MAGKGTEQKTLCKENLSFLKMKKKPIQVCPSIFAADFGKLSDEAKRIEDSGADAIHFDIMDGQFVPNLTLGPKALAAVRRSCNLFLDVHIMVYHPFQYIESLVESGADRITFHFEATEDIEETIGFIHKCNRKAGLALCPETSFSFLPKYMSQLDLVLLMTVHPGFGGQAFIPTVLEKIADCRHFIEDHKLSTSIQVDGGINLETAAQCIKAGADVLVAGTYLFSLPDMSKGINELRQIGSA